MTPRPTTAIIIKMKNQTTNPQAEVRSLLKKLTASGFQLESLDTGDADGRHLAEFMSDRAFVSAFKGATNARLQVFKEGGNGWQFYTLDLDLTCKAGEIILDHSSEVDLDRIALEHYSEWLAK